MRDRDDSNLEQRLQAYYQRRYQQPPDPGAVWASVLPELDRLQERGRPGLMENGRRLLSFAGRLAARPGATLKRMHEENESMKDEIQIDKAVAHDSHFAQTKQPLRRRLQHLAEAGIAAVLVASLLFAWFAITRSRSSTATPAPIFSYSQPNADIYEVKWTPDRHYLTFMMCIHHECHYMVWNAVTRQIKQTLTIGSFLAPSGGSGGENIVDSPDGRYSLIITYDATKQLGIITLANIFTGQVKQIYQGNTYANIPVGAFSNESKYIAIVGGDQHIRVWDIAAGKISLTTGRAGAAQFQINVLSWSVDNRRIFTGALSTNGDRPVILQEWSAQTGQRLANIAGTPSMSLLPFSPPVDNGGFSPDGQRILTFNVHKNTLEERESDTLKVLQTFPVKLLQSGGMTSSGVLYGTYTTPAWLADGTRILAGNQQGCLWNAATGKLLQTSDICGKGEKAPRDGVGRYTAVWQTDTRSNSRFEILDTTTGAKVATIALATPMNLYWLPDDRHLVFTYGNHQEQGQLYDALTGQLVASFQGNEVTLSKDGKYLAVSNTLLDPQTNEPIKSTVQILALR